VAQDRGGPTPNAPSETEAGAIGRRQRAGFSLFLDQVTDEHGQHVWESRLYHAESGVETTIPGASPDAWIAWILDQLGGAAVVWPDAGSRGRRAVMEMASVEIVDVWVEDDPGDERGVQLIKAEVTVQLTGMGPLEREIGSQVIQGIVRSRAERPGIASSSPDSPHTSGDRRLDQRSSEP
jgi:hypothetical protein